MSEAAQLHAHRDTPAQAPHAQMHVLMPDWPAPAHALTTTRALEGASRGPFAGFNLGAHCGDEAEAVAHNRQSLIQRFNLPAAPRWLRQVHGTAVATFDASSAGESPEADAAITRTPGVVLVVLTADCLPILLSTDDGGEVGAIHAGWRGLAAGVIERALEQLRAPRERLIAWLGPAIGPQSYEVGIEVRDAFLAHDAAAAAAFAPTRDGHWRCDLYALARLRLAACGVARVFGGGFDTLTDARFFSHRRDRVTGRFASLIWIRESFER
jgi:YfiH family protein